MRATTTGLRTKALLVFQSGAIVACGEGRSNAKLSKTRTNNRLRTTSGSPCDANRMKLAAVFKSNRFYRHSETKIKIKSIFDWIFVAAEKYAKDLIFFLLLCCVNRKYLTQQG
jgi:hypothetical protein